MHHYCSDNTEHESPIHPPEERKKILHLLSNVSLCKESINNRPKIKTLKLSRYKTLELNEPLRCEMKTTVYLKKKSANEAGSFSS